MTIPKTVMQKKDGERGRLQAIAAQAVVKQWHYVNASVYQSEKKQCLEQLEV
jgi:hypothetical protein